MNLLLDTCSFLWLVTDASQLSDRARELFADPRRSVFLSTVSAWEITVKYGMGRLMLDREPELYVPHYRQLHHIQTLPLEEMAATKVGKLPALHKDPFDRMLICQAIFHGLTLLTPDPLIAQYPVARAW